MVEALPQLVETYEAMVEAYYSVPDVDPSLRTKVYAVCLNGLSVNFQAIERYLTLIKETKGKDPTPFQLLKFGLIGSKISLDRAEKQYQGLLSELSQYLLGEERDLHLNSDFTNIGSLSRYICLVYAERKDNFGIGKISDSDEYNLTELEKKERFTTALKERKDDISINMGEGLIEHAREKAGLLKAIDINEFIADGRRLYTIYLYPQANEIGFPKNIKLEVHGFRFPNSIDRKRYNKAVNPYIKEGIHFPEPPTEFSDYVMRIGLEKDFPDGIRKRLERVQQILPKHFVFVEKTSE